MTVARPCFACDTPSRGVLGVLDANTGSPDGPTIPVCDTCRPVAEALLSSMNDDLDHMTAAGLSIDDAEQVLLAKIRGQGAS